ncbi:hypothetical protein [Petrachloros mirabilis]
MNLRKVLSSRAYRPAVAIVTLICLVGRSDLVLGQSCRLAPQHAGVTFPVERVDHDWACRLQPVIENYTTANKVGPLRTATTESVYLYLLDRPHLATALINRLAIGLYKAEPRGPGRNWVTDGEGTEGIVELVYQDRTSRIYYIEGSHQNRVIPNMSGKAVVFLRITSVKNENGMEVMDSTIVAYTKLNNRILSGLASLVRPLIGGMVARKMIKGVETVNRLGLEMRRNPDRFISEVTTVPPPLPESDLAFLKEAVGFQQAQPSGSQPKTPAP